ncbi:MAG: prephenate/arogenate dehydrogenase [Merismopedia sp. SIO2A8]|nr:prephenate/arogenate dehydrogenase [Symploca sp. SIO2B6]NET49219.1 prephenate/arogenate dehydrogenase [Merismopedia sp. SIO2A8]
MNIGIVGLGLIGGSMGIDLKALGTHKLMGVSRRATTCEQAVAQGIMDEASPNLAILASADVIFLCTPLAALRPTVEQLVPHLSAHTILTDVGSVKASVVQELAPLWPNFVGGHPMAGTAESGLSAAQSKLFVDKVYALTPIERTPSHAVEVVASIARSLQCQVIHCRPDDHDRAVALISHLPVMVSASLISACTADDSETVRTLAQTLASSGFRDTSRVGGGNPELGIMMARYNRDALLRSLSAYRTQLDAITHLIETEDWSALEEILKRTQGDRLHFL